MRVSREFDARDLSQNLVSMKIQALKMLQPFLIRIFPGWVCLIMLTACGNNPIDVEDLVTRAPDYNGKIITVNGCYWIGFEMEILTSCRPPEPNSNWEEKAIWFERYSYIQEKAKSFRNDRYLSEFKEPERELTEKERQMESELAGSQAVIVRGEFQSSSEPRFGNEGKYKYQFILHRVISISKIKLPANQIKH
jgi:hypothetical protein